MYKKEKILQVAEEIYEEARGVKPYVIVAQPRRDKKEKAAQNLEGCFDVHVNFDGFSHAFVDIEGEKVDVARNFLMEAAIESGAKYMLFVGEDTVFPFDGFLKLHEVAEKNPKAMITGVYYVKISVPMIMVNKDGYVIPANVDPGQLIESWQTGLDCALIPIQLLKEMKESDPEIPFCCCITDNSNENKPFIGEDNFFEYRVRKMGYKILTTTDVQCLHMDLASGKYTAHPSVNLEDYFTQIPVTTPLTFEDRRYITKRWVDRIPKGSENSEVKNGTDN